MKIINCINYFIINITLTREKDGLNKSFKDIEHCILSVQNKGFIYHR